MALPELDQQFLLERKISYQLVEDSGMQCLVLPDWKLPTGFTVDQSDLLLRFAPGYPDIAPDMWWFDPLIARSDGSVIEATQVQEQHLGRMWQRWSRHFEPGQWNSGTDGLENFLSLVRAEVTRSAAGVAA